MKPARCHLSKLYSAINSGALPARKNCKRSVILCSDLEAWLSALPISMSAAERSYGALKV
jgi:hypothetical protein